MNGGRPLDGGGSRLLLGWGAPWLGERPLAGGGAQFTVEGASLLRAGRPVRWKGRPLSWWAALTVGVLLWQGEQPLGWRGRPLAVKGMSHGWRPFGWRGAPWLDEAPPWLEGASSTEGALLQEFENGNGVTLAPLVERR